MQIKKKDIGWSLLCPIALVIYEVLFLLLNNIEETQISDGIKPLIVSLALVLVCYIFCAWFIKDVYAGGLLSALSYILIVNYKYIENLVRGFSYKIRYWHLITVFAFLVVLLAYICKCFSRNELIRDISRIVSLVFIGLCFFNVITNAKNIRFQKERPAINAVSSEVNWEKGQPNVYYFIIDEYSNFDILKKYYGDSNQNFYDFLTEKGFTISDHSMNELANQYTLYITTNYLNLDYVSFASDENATATANGLRNNPPLFRIFADNYYDINCNWGSVNWTTQDEAIEAEKENQATTIDGLNFSQLFWNNSIIYPFLQGDSDEFYYDLRNKQYDYVLNHIYDSFSSKFSLFYNIGGHEPFVFDEEGNRVPKSERTNLSDPQYYLGQYRFVTKQLMKQIVEILNRDPDCVIIMMSDHSMRKTQDTEGRGIVEDEDISTIFNAVYYCGESLPEINNQSGVNTLRIILDKLFGTSMGIVEVP